MIIGKKEIIDISGRRTMDKSGMEVDLDKYILPEKCIIVDPKLNAKKIEIPEYDNKKNEDQTIELFQTVAKETSEEYIDISNELLPILAAAGILQKEQELNHEKIDDLYYHREVTLVIIEQIFDQATYIDRINREAKSEFFQPSTNEKRKEAQEVLKNNIHQFTAMLQNDKTIRANFDKARSYIENTT